MSVMLFHPKAPCAASASRAGVTCSNTSAAPALMCSSSFLVSRASAALRAGLSLNAHHACATCRPCAVPSLNVGRAASASRTLAPRCHVLLNQESSSTGSHNGVVSANKCIAGRSMQRSPGSRWLGTWAPQPPSGGCSNPTAGCPMGRSPLCRRSQSSASAGSATTAAASAAKTISASSALAPPPVVDPAGSKGRDLATPAADCHSADSSSSNGGRNGTSSSRVSSSGGGGGGWRNRGPADSSSPSSWDHPPAAPTSTPPPTTASSLLRLTQNDHLLHYHHHQHLHQQQQHSVLQLPQQQQQQAHELLMPHTAAAGSVWRQVQPLAPGRVQVWWTPLDQASTCDPSRVARYSGCLSTAETAEVAGSKSEGVAAKRVAARVLARSVLARAVSSGAGPGAGSGGSGGSGGGGSWSGAGPLEQVLPQELEFRRNSHGKPHLLARPGWPSLCHNLTHTHDLAGVALLNTPTSSPPALGMRVSYSVGLDVERLDRAPRNPLALARRRLAAAEVRDLEALSGEERARHFMWLWTLKEAFVKARGTGINAPPGLKGFAIGFEDTSNSRLEELVATCGGACRVAPSVKTITLHHTAGTAAAAAAGGGGPKAAVASGLQEGDKPSDPGLCSFDPASTHFSFLLFQPTPNHVGALCLAAHVEPVAGSGFLAAAGDGACRGGQGVDCGGREHQAPWGLGCLAPSVEHWWCVPLEVEGRLGMREVTLLGAS